MNLDALGRRIAVVVLVFTGVEAALLRWLVDVWWS